MRIIILTAVVLASLGTTLYQVKTGIDERQAELRRLHANIVTTQRDISVLEAEWAFLSRPDRVMNLSTSLLNMKPISRDRVLPLDAIPMRLQADTNSADRVSCENC
jgi:hypothetical protein